MVKIRIAIVDDEIDWIKIIERKIANENDFLISWSAVSEQDAVAKARQFEDTDIILMDIDMNGERLSGVKSAIQIKQFSSAKIVILSSITDEEIIKYALSVVIEDYVFKEELDELAFRIRRAYKGNQILNIASKEINNLKKEALTSGFSEEVKKLFNLLMEGLTQTEIQNRLSKSIDTIKTQTKKIHQKLKVKNTKEAVRKVNTLGLLHNLTDDEQK